jgi:tetratricopeptide (TPR) repeat protein
MLEIVVLLVLAFFAFRATYKVDEGINEIPDKVGLRLGRLWDIAHQGMRENKLLRAEKALLTILKIDEKNAAAYNRLGILYAKQKEYKDAIDCFEIASSIEKSASSLHNLGLIYYETGDYQRASIAFEEALGLDEGMAARHIAYAKVEEKLGNDKKMISELERAAELEPNKETYSLLLRAYEVKDMDEEAKALQRKLNRMLGSGKAAEKPKRVQRPPRVVV